MNRIDFLLDRWNGIEAQRAERGDADTDHWLGVCKRLLDSYTNHEKKVETMIEQFYTHRAEALAEYNAREAEAASDTVELATDEQVNEWANQPDDEREAGL